MAKFLPFEQNPFFYESWFVDNYFTFQSELKAIKSLLPKEGKSLDIGMGSGRFAFSLGIKLGVEPSEIMREMASFRGLEPVDGVAEDLPFPDSEFEFAIMITSICFFDSVEKAFSEAYRILKPNGSLIIGLIDKNSPGSKDYQNNKETAMFYGVADFCSVDQVVSDLKKAGFSEFHYKQTIFKNLKLISEIEPVKDGYGKGLFVVVKAVK